MLSWDCRKFLDHLLDTDLEVLSTKLLICTFWRLLEAFILTMPADILLVGSLPDLLFSTCLLRLLFLTVHYCHTFCHNCWKCQLLQDADKRWFSRLEDLFVFFANSHLRHVFKEHRHYLVSECKVSLVRFLSRFFTEEGDYF